MAAVGQGPDHRPAVPLRRAGWVAGWAAILTYAFWLARLAPAALVLCGIAALVWTIVATRFRDRAAIAASLALWLAVGIGAGIEYRLAGITDEWPALQLRIEENAADALGEALDALLEEGERAVEGAAALLDERADRETLFRALDALQANTGVSAIGLFGPDGSAVAWAGEHRGSVPEEARAGTLNYLYEEGPLFSYLYFVRPLNEGVTAMAAFLLEANVGVADGAPSFAASFERRHGILPRFWQPDRVRAEVVWDWATDRPILSVSFAELTQQHWWQRVVLDGRRAGAAAGLLALLLMSAAWYRLREEPAIIPVGMGTAALLIAPLGSITGVDSLFSPLQFVLPGPFDLTLGSMLIFLVGASVWALSSSRGGGGQGVLPPLVAVPLLFLVFPGALALVQHATADALLATRAAGGFSVQLGTMLLIALPTFLILRWTRAPEVVGNRVPRAIGYVLPTVLGIGLLLWWQPDQAVPIGFAAGWGAAAAILALVPPRRAIAWRAFRPWIAAGWLAGTAALAFLWPMHVEAELARAEREIEMLGVNTDPFLDFLLRQYAGQAGGLAGEGAGGVNLLYSAWVGSGLAGEGYEARISLWRNGEVETELNLSSLGPLPDTVRGRILAPRTEPFVHYYGGEAGLHYLLVSPLEEDLVVSVAVPPRRRISWATPLASLLHGEEDVDAALRRETLHLVAVEPGAGAEPAVPVAEDTVRWIRTGDGWRSETLVHMPEGPVHAHMDVATPPLPLLLTRALLLQSALLLVSVVIWMLARMVCRELPGSTSTGRGWLRSFRGRVSLALFAFFLLPTLAFGFVSYGAVAREVVRSAGALAQQSLDQASSLFATAGLPEVGDAAGAEVLMYRGGTLLAATAPELIALGLFDSWLPPEIYLRFADGEEVQALEERRVAGREYLLAYRRLDPADVLAVPVALASHEITRRQQEFRDLTLLLTLLGLVLSVVLALMVSRALSRPLDELSRAAALVGGGDLRTPLPDTRGDEFGAVYGSFNAMVRRLRDTRAALVQETQRTETIVAEAATGVLALDADGRVELINPRASRILEGRVSEGEPLVGPGADGGVIASAVAGLWSSPATEADTELELDGRVIRLRLRRLSGDDAAGGAGGAVLALEDVTAEVRTARVLAWGEMARQVAHEIKNPLTPIKLSVQHIRRAYLDQRPDFRPILESNVDAVLREIDRLGEIARAFSRFGTPSAVAAPLEEVVVEDAVREVLTLYGGSEASPDFRAELGDAPLPRVVVRAGELKEVLLNLLENAREAVEPTGTIVISAQQRPEDGRVVLAVRDDGAGIPEDQLPWIFEPHFSTRSSGTGLGLAIVRRIVESWGAEIAVDSVPGRGTRFEIVLRTADD